MFSQRNEKQKTGYLILHNIRSVYNVGSMLRTADAAGVDKVYLTGYTPSPVDRFGKKRKDLEKTSLGAEENVPWQYFKDISFLITALQKKNVEILALEQHSSSVDHRSVNPSSFALIVGNEVRGISGSIIAKTDKVIEIPMKGKKESLNVAVACGIAIFQLLHE
ncbi:MAG: TrmH family RNA methyltransferase [Candidatus Paceibacterota bacterium]